jgi:hypothetical protein
MIGKRETGLTRVLFCDFENEWLVKTSRKRKNKWLSLNVPYLTGAKQQESTAMTEIIWNVASTKMQ